MSGYWNVKLIAAPLRYEEWRIYGYPLDLSPTAFGPFENFVNIWTKNFNGCELPAWPDFDLMDFKGHWGYLSLFQLLDDGQVYRVTLWGTGLVNLTGREFTGNTLADFHPEDPEQFDSERSYIEFLARTPGIGFWISTFDPFGKGHVRIQCLDLPLSASRQRGEVTHLLSLYRQCELDDQFRPDAAPVFLDVED